MKLSTRPVSSPGRVDKLPPQLMRFLRTNGSSRSTRRSRSRASPIFVKQRTGGGAETKEPSSPKVTCMGQVRVRRSKQGLREKGSRRGRHDRRGWIPGISSGRRSKGGGVRLSFFRRSLSCIPSWSKWVSFFRFGRGGESGGKDEGFGHGHGDTVEEDDEEEEEEEEEEGKVNCFGPSPPKTALILTRCRSAPYTSSSLAYRFWGSPLEAERTVQRRSTDEGSAGEGGERKGPDCDGNPSRGIPTDLELCNMDKTGGALVPGRVDGFRTRDGVSDEMVPTVLIRCKSGTGKERRDYEAWNGRFLFWTCIV